jgi:hypothetical protein
MGATGPCFHELDDLVLHLKGLVLVREVRKRDHAGDDELENYDDEIGRVRERLARVFWAGGGAAPPPA